VRFYLAVKQYKQNTVSSVELLNGLR